MCSNLESFLKAPKSQETQQNYLLVENVTKVHQIYLLIFLL